MVDAEEMKNGVKMMKAWKTQWDCNACLLMDWRLRQQDDDAVVLLTAVGMMMI